MVSWLFCIATTLFYGFNNEGYLDNKSYPLYDMGKFLTFFMVEESGLDAGLVYFLAIARPEVS